MIPVFPSFPQDPLTVIFTLHSKARTLDVTFDVFQHQEVHGLASESPNVWVQRYKCLVTGGSCTLSGTGSNQYSNKMLTIQQGLPRGVSYVGK